MTAPEPLDAAAAAVDLKVARAVAEAWRDLGHSESVEHDDVMDARYVVALLFRRGYIVAPGTLMAAVSIDQSTDVPYRIEDPHPAEVELAVDHVTWSATDAPVEPIACTLVARDPRPWHLGATALVAIVPTRKDNDR